MGSPIAVGWAFQAPYTFIVYAWADKAKPSSRFTRYLPGIRLMVRLRPVGMAGVGA